MRAPANMPAAPQPFEPAGLCADQPQGNMNLQPQINPLASSDVGGTAGHDAAACVSARGKCDGERVCDARDANCIFSPTTQSLQARQVVAPQAQNSGTGAAVSGLAISPTIESADSNTPAASAFKDTTKGKITAYFVKSTADGRARRSAVRGPSPPSVPSVSIPVPTPAGVAPLDAVAPLRPYVSQRVKFDLPPAGVTPFNAVAPSVPSVAPPALRRRTVAFTNDSPISQPTGAAPQHSTNDSPILQPTGAASQHSTDKFISRTRLYVAHGSRLVASGTNPRARANLQAPPAQTSNNTIFTNDTSSNLKQVEFSPNVTIEESPNVPIEESPVVTEESPNVTIEESPNVTIEESPHVTIEESPNVTVKKSKTRLREDKKLKKQASGAKDNSSGTLLPWANYTYAELRKYREEMEMALTGYCYALLPESPIDVSTPTQAVSEPSTPKPLTHVPRRRTPPTPPMGRLAKEAAKVARNTPKAVSILLTPLPQVVKADQAPTAGIPPVPDPLEPTILPQVVEAGDVRGATLPPVTPEPTIPPLETFPPAPVPLTGAQETVANTARKQARHDAHLFAFRQRSIRVDPRRSGKEVANLAARTSPTTHTTLHRHVHLRKRDLAALSEANSVLSTFKATTFKDARVLAIHASVASRVSQTARSVLLTSVEQELDSHSPGVTEAFLAPSSLKKLFHHFSRIAPLSPKVDKPGLDAKKPTRKRIQVQVPDPDPFQLYRAATRRVKAATINLNQLLETQKQLDATKDGPFMVPGLPPPVLALPFVPPSWATIMTGGYRHHVELRLVALVETGL